jgi:hypothetical protein
LYDEPLQNIVSTKAGTTWMMKSVSPHCGGWNRGRESQNVFLLYFALFLTVSGNLTAANGVNK